jgi:predicted phage tail protein
VSGLADGTKYYCTVKAITAEGTSAASAQASATPAATTAPTAPRTLTAAAGNATAKLTWTAPASDGGKPVSGYDVYKGTLPGHELATPVNAKPLAATATSYTATGLTDAVGYYFTVKAISAAGTGAPSNEVTATPEPATTLPCAPRSLKATAGTGQAALAWTAPEWDGGSAITGYNVYRGTALGHESATPVNTSPLPATARSYTVTGLSNGTRYYFTVKAINAVGASDPSNEAAAKP